MLMQPTVKDLMDVAAGEGWDLDPEESSALRTVCGRWVLLLDAVEQSAKETPSPMPSHRRVRGYMPSGTYANGWSFRANRLEATEGPLLGMRLAMKDNIAVAGMPMTVGSPLFDDLVVNDDADVVRRILQAGGVIMGKAACEDLCFSAGSHTSLSGVVTNPWDRARTAGGSSSGCAALVAAGEVDVSVGTDHGGSILIPSAYCGVVGLKPTWGTVPYSGIVSWEPTLDHVGPIARTVDDVRKVMGVLSDDFTRNAQCGVAKHAPLRLAVITEAFGDHGTSVDLAVLALIERLRSSGVRISEASVPLHTLGAAIWVVIATIGGAKAVTSGDIGHRDDCLGDFRRRYVTSLRERWPMVSPAVKAVLLFSKYVERYDSSALYSRARRLAQHLRAMYDGVLANVDAMIMPTVGGIAPMLPPACAPLDKYLTASLSTTSNAPAFNVTGHPAMTVPCGLANGLPVGALLVGKWGDDSTVLRCATVVERCSSRHV